MPNHSSSNNAITHSRLHVFRIGNNIGEIDSLNQWGACMCAEQTQCSHKWFNQLFSSACRADAHYFYIHWKPIDPDFMLGLLTGNDKAINWKPSHTLLAACFRIILDFWGWSTWLAQLSRIFLHALTMTLSSASTSEFCGKIARFLGFCVSGSGCDSVFQIYVSHNAHHLSNT